jgi:hypothetical protein
MNDRRTPPTECDQPGRGCCQGCCRRRRCDRRGRVNRSSLPDDHRADQRTDHALLDTTTEGPPSRQAQTALVDSPLTPTGHPLTAHRTPANTRAHTCISDALAARHGESGVCGSLARVSSSRRCVTPWSCRQKVMLESSVAPSGGHTETEAAPVILPGDARVRRGGPGFGATRPSGEGQREPGEIRCLEMSGQRELVIDSQHVTLHHLRLAYVKTGNLMRTPGTRE